MTIKDVFKMEYGMSQGFMKTPEFYEGVRALLVEKDKKPRWKHANVNEVTRDDV